MTYELYEVSLAQYIVQLIGSTVLTRFSSCHKHLSFLRFLEYTPPLERLTKWYTPRDVITMKYRTLVTWQCSFCFHKRCGFSFTVNSKMSDSKKGEWDDKQNEQRSIGRSVSGPATLDRLIVATLIRTICLSDPDILVRFICHADPVTFTDVSKKSKEKRKESVKE